MQPDAPAVRLHDPLRDVQAEAAAFHFSLRIFPAHESPDTITRFAERGGRKIELTTREYRLLEFRLRVGGVWTFYQSFERKRGVNRGTRQLSEMG